MTEIATINLDAPITREQYQEAITKLLAEANRVGDFMGWCSERHRYFGTVIEEYSRYNDSFVDFTLVPENVDYAARIRSIRAQILWYVNARTITFENGNRFITAMGLPPYDGDNKAGPRYTVELQLSLGITGDDYRRFIESELPNIITRALDGQPVEAVTNNDSHYVPGSVVISIPYFRQLQSNPVINPADMEHPSYG